MGILRGLKVVESASRGTGMVLAFWETDSGLGSHLIILRLRHLCFYVFRLFSFLFHIPDLKGRGSEGSGRWGRRETKLEFRCHMRRPG